MAAHSPRHSTFNPQTAPRLKPLPSPSLAPTTQHPLLDHLLALSLKILVLNPQPVALSPSLIQILVSHHSGNSPQPELIGTYGTWEFNNTTGDWTYNLNNTLQAVQELPFGSTLNDSLRVQSIDETAYKTIDVTITGTNDSASITGSFTGSVVEDSGSQSSASGTLTITDSDSGESTFREPSPSELIGAYGTWAFNNATGDWTYNLDNTLQAVQSLSSGSTLNDSFTVQSIDGNTSRTVEVRITGNNDLLDIKEVTDVEGNIFELGVGSTGERTATLIDSGSFSVTDVDLDDIHIVSMGQTFSSATSDRIGQERNTLGTLDTIISTDSNNEGSKTINWFYSVTDETLDFMEEGQVIQESFELIVGDQQGSTISQTVTVSLSGARDADLTITELTDGDTQEGSFIHSESGVIAASQYASLGGIAGIELSSSTSTAPSSILSQESATLGKLILSPGESGLDVINWNYSVPDNSLDFLQKGQIITETFTLAISDQQGGITSETYFVNLEGSNDGPLITATTKVSGLIQEVGDGATGEGALVLSDTGSFSISDIDLSDVQTVTVSSSSSTASSTRLTDGSNTLGTLEAYISDNTTDDGAGEVNWKYTVSDSIIEYLSDDQQLQEEFVLSISDGNGGTVDQTISLILEGKADAAISVTDISPDTGSSQSDFITQRPDQGIQISGKAVGDLSGSKIQISSNNGFSWHDVTITEVSTSDSTTYWEYQDNKVRNIDRDVDYIARIKPEDKLDEDSIVNYDEIVIKYDTTSPRIPSFSTPEGSAGTGIREISAEDGSTTTLNVDRKLY